MSLPGERLIIAATLDSVERGETFHEIPPHMTVVRWFNLQENRRFRLANAMDRFFTDQPVFDKTIGGRKASFGDTAHPVPVRLVNGIETVKVRADKEGNNRFVNPEWFALHALIRSIGSFDEDDLYKDAFVPHISDTKDFTLGYRKRVSFDSVAVFGTEDKHQDYRVIDSFPLGHE
ncbi:MAG TPA: hypothetical protein VIM31_03005 [Candidatus Microsaccharimonas sp.]|jgi:hypothetical protein